jgi:hypothetical protein
MRAEPYVIDGRVRCGARTRQGRPCPNLPVQGRQRCRMHGGLTPIARPDLWKDGRPPEKWSRLLPNATPDLAALIQSPDELLSLRAEILLWHDRLRELVTQAAGLPTADDWAQALGAVEAGKTAEALAILKAGVDAWKAHERALQVSEHIRKLSDTETRRETAKTSSLPVQAAMAFVRLLVSAIQEEPDLPAAVRGRIVGRLLGATQSLPALMGSPAPSPTAQGAQGAIDAEYTVTEHRD